jgi:hypothetical protein
MIRFTTKQWVDILSFMRVGKPMRISTDAIADSDVELYVNTVQKEDGSGCSFNFWGRTAEPGRSIKGYFNERKQSGHYEYFAETKAADLVITHKDLK